MSLVILSNDAKEQTDLVSSIQSIYKPWSFRNSLSSTMEIPANAQLALTSAKISLDGQISLAAGEKILYVYIGRVLTGDQTIQNSNSYPIKVKLFEDQPGVVVTDTKGLADETERALNKFITHPHYAKRSVVSVNRNATTGEFEGYKFELKQTSSSEGLLPSAPGSVDMIAASRDMFSLRARATPLLRRYTITASANNGVTLTPLANNIFTNHILATTFEPTVDTPPISLTGGSVTFDLSKCIGNIPAGSGSNLNSDFICGLSRYCTQGQRAANNRIGPAYYYWGHSAHTAPGEPMNKLGRCFADFVLVNSNGELRLFDTATYGVAARAGAGGNRRSPRWREIDYTQGGTQAAPFNTFYNTTQNNGRFDKVKFTTTGEQIKIELIDTQGNTSTLYSYSQLRRDGVTPRSLGENFKPIDQSCESLVPVMGLYIEGVAGAGNNPQDYSITLERYTCIDLTDIPNVAYTTDFATYEADPVNTIIPWFNRVEQELPVDASRIITSIDNRALRLTDPPYGGMSINDQFTGCWNPVILTSPSPIYAHAQGANTMRLYGFSELNGIAGGIPPWVDEGEDADDQFVYSLVSSETPTALSSKSIFVRVDNFNQTSTNAANGNKSGIIAHLPRFDGQQQTGRLFFEPKNLIYLDLNNPAPMKINSFDISFVYSDETYCTSLVGSSIVTLHIRKKGSTD